MGALRLPRLRNARFRGGAASWSYLARRGAFLEAPKMQRNQRISSRSAIPTRERLASKVRECTSHTSGHEERLTIYRYCTAEAILID
jgi:hypothetical protein